MPDRRKHRGKHPADSDLFDHGQLPALRKAVAEHSWLLTRGYAPVSALKLVGDRHSLAARQRLAVMRSSCSDQALGRREMTQVSLESGLAGPLAIDGYNLLITVESALSHGLILTGRDGCCRDLASVHGTYRKVQETKSALEIIFEYVDDLGCPRIDWYLDRPVSNSGRLRTLMAEMLERRAPSRTTWNIELVDSPDKVLAECPGTIVTSDSAILNRCSSWVNLATGIATTHVPDAWVVDLR